MKYNRAKPLTPLAKGTRVMRHNGVEVLTGTVVGPWRLGEVLVRWDGDEIAKYIVPQRRLLVLEPAVLETPEE